MTLHIALRTSKVFFNTCIWLCLVWTLENPMQVSLYLGPDRKRQIKERIEPGNWSQIEASIWMHNKLRPKQTVQSPKPSACYWEKPLGVSGNSKWTIGIDQSSCGHWNQDWSPQIQADQATLTAKSMDSSANKLAMIYVAPKMNNPRSRRHKNAWRKVDFP